MIEGKKMGYATTTYKVRLYIRHMDWLNQTKLRYNEVLSFYYRLLLSHTELLALSNQRLLRQMEIISIGEKRKSGKEASCPLPYEKTPLYFRRAAINAAIAMVRSQESRRQKTCAGAMNASPVYYKGMYKQFENGHILLKLWTGKRWVWVKYRYQAARKIPEGAICLSPSLKVNRKSVLLHLPVVQPVEDIRTVRERIVQREKVCAVAFPNNNNLAVCASLDSDGRFERAFFIKGGKELKHRRKRYLENSKHQNKERRREKIHHLTDDYAHKASHEIVKFCLNHGIKILAVPKYRNSLQFNKKGCFAASDYDWIGRRIIRYLEYKAFQAGIAVTKLPPHHSAASCYQCGGRIKKYNEGRLYCCPMGHRGNTALNSARNLLKYFEEKLVYEYVS